MLTSQAFQVARGEIYILHLNSPTSPRRNFSSYSQLKYKNIFRTICYFDIQINRVYKSSFLGSSKAIPLFKSNRPMKENVPDILGQ